MMIDPHTHTVFFSLSLSRSPLLDAFVIYARRRQGLVLGPPVPSADVRSHQCPVPSSLFFSLSLSLYSSKEDDSSRNSLCVCLLF